MVCMPNVTLRSDRKLMIFLISHLPVLEVEFHPFQLETIIK